MIRKIHYCWFGPPMPDSVRQNLDKWKQLNPDFELIEWNESTIDVSAYEFGRRCLDQKKWGFLGDVVRLQALYEHGGFYLDCDIELFRSLSELPVSDHRMTLGYIYKCALGTAFLYAPPGHLLCRTLLDLYDRIKEDSWPVSNTIYTDHFINHVPGFLPNGKYWSNEYVEIYPKEYFEQPSFIRTKGFSIHHCCGSWSPIGNQSFQLRFSSNHYIKWLKRKINTELALRRNEFYPFYKAAKKGIRLSRESTWLKSTPSSEKTLDPADPSTRVFG